MAVSCAKENVAQDINSKTDGFVMTRTEGDCECFMRIDEVLNSNINPGSTETGDTWSVKDVTNSLSGATLFSGIGKSLFPALSPLPSNFSPLSIVGDDRRIEIIYDFGGNEIIELPVPEDFTVIATIRCTKEKSSGGSYTVSEIQHTFVWSDADAYDEEVPNNPGDPVYVFFAYFDIASGCVDDEDPIHCIVC